MLWLLQLKILNYWILPPMQMYVHSVMNMDLTWFFC